ncbi:hypothetical protein [Desulfosarcina variabilis]|uniref:hypothetical protein n=1 Tax=Desulfosarcina variabilis TaxID=2300 RepID=UPI003AFB59CA
MKNFDKISFGILATINGGIWIYISIFGLSGFSISGLIIGLFSLLYLPYEYRRRMRQIDEMKRKYKLDGDYTLEELEKIRIERDYQDNFVKKLKID